METLLKTSARGYGAGLNKRRFKVVYFTSANILSTLPPSVWYGSYHKVFESKKPKQIRNKMQYFQEKLKIGVFDMIYIVVDYSRNNKQKKTQ